MRLERLALRPVRAAARSGQGILEGEAERALDALLAGPLPEAVVVRGISKSAVSERFVYGTERKLGELMSRELRDWFWWR